MGQLRGALFATFGIAVFSSLFLYASYVRSAAAAEPVVGAASTEYVEKIVELVVVEKTESPPPVAQEVVIENEGEEEIVEEIDLATDVIDITEEIEIAEEAKEPVTEKELVDVKTKEESLFDLHDALLHTIEQEIHSRSNEARADKGRKLYVLDEALSALARERSQDMLSRNYFSHTAPDGCGITCNFEASGYATLVWGENIARYEPFNEITTRVIAEVFVEKWLKSSGHRENLLSKEYTHHGIGLAVEDGVLIATVLFAAP